MNPVVRNGHTIEFGVGERVCPPGQCEVGTGVISAAVHPPDVKLAVRAAETAARAAALAHPGMTPAQVYELARRNAETAALREAAGRRGAADHRHPAVVAAIRNAAHEAALAHAWRPEWGRRPAGFGAAQWRPEWGTRPAWFGARQWRREWGAQPAWWAAHQTALATPQPDPPSTAGTTPAATASDSNTPDATVPAADASAAPTTTPTDAAATPSPGLSTPAKIGIGVAVVAAVGGTVAVLASSSGKKKKKAAPGASPAD